MKVPMVRMIDGRPVEVGSVEIEDHEGSTEVISVTVTDSVMALLVCDSLRKIGVYAPIPKKEDNNG